MFYFSVEEILLGYGWMKAKDKNDTNFKLKWCESRLSIDFTNFRECEPIKNSFNFPKTN